MFKNRLTPCVLTLAGILLVGPANAQDRLTARDLVAIKVPSELSLSSDGRRLVFVVAEADFERSRANQDLYLWRDGELRRLTHTSESDEWSPRFSADGRWIAFLSDRQSPKAGKPDEEDPEPQVWLIAADGGEALPITTGDEGADAFDWMPDGKSLVYTTQESPPPPESEKRTANRERKADHVVADSERYRKEFWRVEVTTGKSERVAAGDLGVDAFRVSPDGKQLVYESNLSGFEGDSMKTNLWILSLEDGSKRQLTTNGGGTTGARWSRDGKSIAYVAYSDPRYEYSRVDAYVVPAAGGDPVDVSKAFDRSVSQVEWSGDETLVGVVVTGTTQQVIRLSRSGSPSVEPFPGLVSEVAANASGAFMVAESSDSGPEVFNVRDAKSITALNAGIDRKLAARQEVIRWKGADGLDIEGILLYPLGFQKDRRYPTIVLIHGGPFWNAMVSLRSLSWAQLFASNGYAVLLPNYRGSDGYGDSFAQANRGDLGGKDYQDIIAGVDRVVAMGVADPNRLGVAGHSYGGYMTNWIISQTDRFKGAVSSSGIFNFVTDFSNSVNTNWEPEYFNGYYWERNNLDLYLKRSPAKFAANIKTPVLIVHGDADDNTFISNSKEMFQALKMMRRRVEFVQLPREEHEYAEPNHLVEFGNRSLAWMDTHVKGNTSATREYFEVGEFAPSGGWEYSVEAVDAEVEYSGRAPAGKFVEATMLFRCSMVGAKLDVAVSDAILELPDGTQIHPVGVVTNAAGVRAIAIGDARVVAESNGSVDRTYVPLVVAFDVPAAAKTARLRLGKHAPFRIALEQ